MIARPPSTRRGRSPDEGDGPDPAAQRQRRDEESDGPDDVEEVVDHPEPPPAERARKKRRRKKYHLPETESSAWPWWVFGGGSIFLVMFLLLCMAVFSPSGSLGKVFAAYLLVAIPLSAVIFFVAMYLSSVLVGAIEIGELHVAAVKSFYLVLIVNLVSLIPCGRFLTFLVWLAGFMSLFRLDIWEAKVLLFVNWVLNFIVQLFVFAAIASLVLHGGSRDNHGVWGDLDIAERGGSVEYDQKNPDADIVIGISFRDGRPTDADLAHMKDFPRLVKLDLTNTPITDAGLAHLKPCKGLQVLILTRTRVTDAGVQELQAALPSLRIVR